MKKKKEDLRTKRPKTRTKRTKRTMTISTWLNDKDRKQHFLLVGPCVRSDLLIQEIQREFKDLTFKVFDCSNTLNITDTCVDSLTLQFESLGSTKRKVFIFYNVDKFKDITISLTDFSKSLVNLSYDVIYMFE